MPPVWAIASFPRIFVLSHRARCHESTFEGAVDDGLLDGRLVDACRGILFRYLFSVVEAGSGRLLPESVVLQIDGMLEIILHR